MKLGFWSEGLVYPLERFTFIAIQISKNEDKEIWFNFWLLGIGLTIIFNNK